MSLPDRAACMAWVQSLRRWKGFDPVTSSDVGHAARPPTSSDRRYWLLLAGLLALLTALTFGSLSALGPDAHDEDNLLDSARISEDAFYLLSTDKHHTSGRPLYEAIIWLEYCLWGDDMRYFHVVGALWHGMAALLLAAVCRRLDLPWEMSGASAVLFLYNVSHYRAVHWISAQCYILSFMIVCASLLLYLAWSEERRVGGQVGFYIMLLSGLLLHTATIVLIPLAAALAWSRRHPLSAVIRQLAVPAALGAGAVLAIRVYYADSPQVGQLSSGFEVWNRTQGLLYMMSRLVSTAHNVSFAVYEKAGWEPVLGALLLLLCLVLARRRDRRLGFWGWWILLTPLPFLVLDPAHLAGLMPGPSRYLYTASAGVAVLGAAALYRMSLLPRIGKAAYLLLVPIVAVSHWQLTRAEGVSHYLSSRHAMSSADWPQAVEQMSRAIDKGGDAVPVEDAYLRLFVGLLATGESVDERLSEAEARLPSSRWLAVLADVLQVESSDPQTRDAALKRIDRHIREQRQVHLESGEQDLLFMSVMFFRNRGLGLARRGEYERALTPLSYALQFDPEHEVTLRSWAAANFRLGRYEEAARVWSRVGAETWAAQSWQKTVEAAPDNTAARLQWARSLARGGALSEAAVQYRRVLQEQESAPVTFESALLFLRLGKEAAARALFERGIEAYGGSEAVRLGVPAQLQQLAADGSATAAQILRTYWSVK